jgi:uncharacterized membrane protein (Fun14 family)
MTDDLTNGKVGALGYVRHHYNGLSIWRRLLVVLSIVFVGIGAAGTVFGKVSGAQSRSIASPAPAKIEELKKDRQAKGFSEEQIRKEVDELKQKTVENAHWFYDTFSPTLMAMGISFFTAFVLGFAFRQFVLTMATVAAIAITLAFVAQIMGWADVASFVRGRAEESKQLADQIYSAGKALVQDRLPSSGSGVAGFLVGFFRRK